MVAILNPDWYAIDQSALAPTERTDTLPKWDGRTPTLGFVAIKWMYDNLVHTNGERAGKPFKVSPRQAQFLIAFYQVDHNGKFSYSSAVRRLAKGSGKSPFAAAHALFELLGPCRFDHFDGAVPGGVVGRPVHLPRVQIAATAESQTKNTMIHVRIMAAKTTKLARRYKPSVGKTKIETPNGGVLEQISSSMGSAEGAEVSFAICDETEHWLPARNGDELKEAIDRNTGKVSGGRWVETCNSWQPGLESVAEHTFNTWVMEQEGRSLSDKRLLYDAVVAPPNTVLHDEPREGEVGLTAALSHVYDDCFWVDVASIRDRILRPGTNPSISRRFFLNQPVTKTGSWVAPHQWAQLANPGRVVEEGEDIVMFFDGSKSDDNSALVGCCMEDGHIFTIGVWEPEEQPDGSREINYNEVDQAVHLARDMYHVVAFWADVAHFESYVHTSWPMLFEHDGLYPARKGGQLSHLIAWDMRSRSFQFATACEAAQNEIERGVFTHDSNSTLAQHVANAVVSLKQGRVHIKKESPKSPRKIDAAVCMVGARMLYRIVKGDPNYEPNHNPADDWLL